MEISQISDIIFKLYLYADATKMIHYTTDGNHAHEMCDKIRNTIVDFADELAEQTFGYYGKPEFNDMNLEQNIYNEKDLNKICQRAIDVIEPLRTEFNKNEKLSGIVSLIDDFKGKLSKTSFLGTFDKLSNINLKK